MSKRQNKEVVLSTPSITQNVNLNLQWSDLIDTYVEEAKELVSKELLSTISRLTKCQPKDDSILLDKIMSELSPLLPNFTFDKESITTRKRHEYLYESIGKIKKISLTTFRGEYMDILALSDFATIEEILSSKGLNLTVREEDYRLTQIKVDEIYISREKSFYFTFLPESHPKLFKKLNKILEVSKTEQEKALQRENELKEKALSLIENFRNLCSEKKIKSKFFKKALAQTEKGAELLKMFSNLEIFSSLKEIEQKITK